MLESNETVNLLIVAPFVQRGIKCNAAELEHVEASKPCRRECRQNALRRSTERIVEWRRSVREINGNRYNWSGKRFGLPLRARQKLISHDPC